jgi:hypothetical protein
LEEAEQVEAAGQAESEEEASAERKTRAVRRRANRGALPAHLPRIETVVDVASPICPGCSGTLHRIAKTSPSGSTLKSGHLTKASRFEAFPARLGRSQSHNGPQPPSQTDGAKMDRSDIDDIRLFGIRQPLEDRRFVTNAAAR